MKKLQQLFDSKLQSQLTPEVILKKFIRGKFKAIGIILKEQTLNELVNRIENTDQNTFEIATEDLQIDKSAITTADETITAIKLEVDEADLQLFRDDFSSAMSEEYPNVVDKTARLILNKIQQDAAVTIKDNQKARKKFEARLRKRWKEPFDLLELFVLLALEAGAEFNEEYRALAAKDNDLVFDVLTRLHARGCQVASEVLTLIKAGFADGAHSRWRTLHELAVVAIFVAKHGREIAEQYLDHEFVEAHKAANQHERYREAIGYEAFPPEELAAIQTAYEEALNRYGSNFRHAYGWASSTLNKISPTFSDIERDVELEKWRPYYKMASHNVHAGAKGITFRLGLLGGHQPVLLAGSTNTGFTDPAQGTAISLMQISVTLLLTRPNLDVFVRCEMLKTIQDEIGDEFLKIQQSIEAEHAAMQVQDLAKRGG